MRWNSSFEMAEEAIFETVELTNWNVMYNEKNKNEKVKRKYCVTDQLYRMKTITTKTKSDEIVSIVDVRFVECY